MIHDRRAVAYPASHQARHVDDELRLRILRLLSEQPEMSQRELALALGLSLGKTNYCLRALIDRGWLKVNNFRTSQNKLAYAYVLTSRGLQAKLSAAARFLKSRQAEYIRLEREIADLRDELAGGQDARPRDVAHR
jgi:EPS-associated MarR family transcriptional regulator